MNLKIYTLLLLILIEYIEIESKLNNNNIYI